MNDQKLLMEQVIRGLKIFSKYSDCHIAAREEVVHAGIDNPVQMPVDEVKELLSLGWHQTELGWARWLT